MRIVKRYSNRRLYDTQSSRTITQFDLARLIQEGHEVKVVDSATGDDITLQVLSRIAVAETFRWDDIKQSKELLRGIISAGGEKSMSNLKNTILASIGVLHVTKAKAESIIDDLIKKGDLDKSDRKKAIMELLDKVEESTAEFSKKVTSGLTWATQDDLKRVERRVNKIAKQLKELAKEKE